MGKIETASLARGILPKKTISCRNTRIARGIMAKTNLDVKRTFYFFILMMLNKDFRPFISR